MDRCENGGGRSGEKLVVALNENAKIVANRPPINWTSIVHGEKPSATIRQQRSSDIRVKSESCNEAKMNSSSDTETLSSSATSNGAKSPLSRGRSNGASCELPLTATPLDFSMKKRKTDHPDFHRTTTSNGGSAFEAVASSSSKSSPLTIGHLLMSKPNGAPPMPFATNPLSLAAAASAHQNLLGAATAAAAVANCHPSSPMVDTAANNRKTSNGSLLAQHLAAQPQQPKNVQRPFKAYDPSKPGSALTVNSFLPPANLATASSMLNTGVPQQLLSDQLLAQYCQYLLSAQALNAYKQQQHGRASVDEIHSSSILSPPANVRANLYSSSKHSTSSSGSDSTNLSPPQVTSTSHPHVDSSTPPASGLDSSPSSVSVGNGAESLSNGENEKSESVDIGDAGSPMITESCTSSSGRRRGKSLPEELKDEAYWERRRKNNEAAKRSRDLRRAKEDEIALRAALLEQENSRLRVEVAALKAETEKLRQMLLNS